MSILKKDPKEKKDKQGKISIFTTKKNEVLVRFSATQNHVLPPKSALQMATALIASAEMAEANIAWGETGDEKTLEIQAGICTAKYYLKDVLQKTNSSELARILADLETIEL